jgi:tRNA(Ile)-lysidine synthase
MLTKFESHITNHFPFLTEKKILIAISGGVDSVVLSHLCNQLNLSIYFAHCNFQLRGEESDADEEFVVSFGEKYACSVFTRKFETNSYADKNKLSIQIAARNLRYEWFSELVEEHNIDYIATAHHLDDSVETFLINLSRGTGIDGLTGIPKKNGNIIRPLLIFSKEELRDYAIQEGLTWREDRSNAETKYLRNKIRHSVVPVLKEANPSFLQSFTKTLGHLEETKAIADQKIKEVELSVVSEKEGVLKINIEKMLKFSNPKTYLYEILKKYNFTEWSNIFDLLFSQSGKLVYSETHVILKDRDSLLVKKREEKNRNQTVYYISENQELIQNPIKLVIKKSDKKKSEPKNYVLVNKNLVTFPIILRKREEGDFFYPTGMKGKKKVSKFFKDEKLSKFKKEETWLLCNSNNDIMWIVGMRQDRRYAIDATSKNILEFSI